MTSVAEVRFNERTPPTQISQVHTANEIIKIFTEVMPKTNEEFIEWLEYSFQDTPTTIKKYKIRIKSANKSRIRSLKQNRAPRLIDQKYIEDMVQIKEDAIKEFAIKTEEEKKTRAGSSL